MKLHSDGSRVLTHYIRPDHLVTLLKTRAFHLFRQDRQSDPSDGVLPAGNFEAPYRGPIEHSLRISDAVLRSHAAAIEADRTKRFVMSWTHDPSEHMKAVYGENGDRCEIQASEIRLKAMLGYQWTNDFEFPPERRSIAEIRGARAIVQLVEPLYTDGTQAISVIPSYFATAHKHEDLAAEAEVRIEAFVEPDGVVSPNDLLIRWAASTFEGLSITWGERVPARRGEEIEGFAAELGIPVRRLM